jgi:hypothetical protein
MRTNAVKYPESKKLLTFETGPLDDETAVVARVITRGWCAVYG